jgi:hypothetical protein
MMAALKDVEPCLVTVASAYSAKQALFTTVKSAGQHCRY